MSRAKGSYRVRRASRATLAAQEANIRCDDPLDHEGSLARAALRSGHGVSLVCAYWYYLGPRGSLKGSSCIWAYVGPHPFSYEQAACAVPLYLLGEREQSPSDWDYFEPARELKRMLSDPLMLLLLAGP